MRMKQQTRRQHFISQCYLRNFANPPFSNNLQVFDKRMGTWRRKSPKSIGWESDFFTVTKLDGSTSDEFDAFWGQFECRVAPVLKRIAQEKVLTEEDRPPLALFIAHTAARSPDLLREAIDG